ncbi:MAG: replicative DNA helicase [Kiritimatiellae bacterium]|nr:replicative DNA helicase [Kiritimatiellia bacterium]
MNDMRTPPSNVEAERAVLGSILLDAVGRSGDRVMDVCLTGGVTAETFYDPRNRALYATMLEMNRASKPLDALTLMEELRVTGRLETVGGVGYVESLIDQVQTTANAEYYLGIIRGKHLRRTMIERAARVVDKCYDEGAYPDPQAVLGEAEKDFLEIGTRGERTMTWSAAVEDSFRRIDKMFSSNGMTFEGLSTGLTHLDEKLQGLKPSEMIVIAARPSVGKTSLAMNIAESAALGQMTTLKGSGYPPVVVDGGKRHPVMIFSLEMPVEALTKRMVAGRAHINMWKLNRNLCARAEKETMTQNLFQAVGELKSAPIYVDDSAGLDIMDLRARARRAKKQYGIELVVIDYLQLCTCREASRAGSRQIEVSMISQQIKAMAKELKIPVIVLSQLSRANEQRGDKYEKPKLSDLRDSGAIEQDADVVFLLRRPSRNAQDPESGDELLAIIDVAKNRNGEIGEVRVNFVREYTRFEDRPLPAGEPGENFRTSEPPPDHAEFAQDPLV